MHNSPNRGINYHIFLNKVNYPVIPIYARKFMIYTQVQDSKGSTLSEHYKRFEGLIEMI